MEKSYNTILKADEVSLIVRRFDLFKIWNILKRRTTARINFKK